MLAKGRCPFETHEGLRPKPRQDTADGITN